MKVIGYLALALLAFGIHQAVGTFAFVVITALGMLIFNRIQTIRASLED